jgi:hypothetical protein
MSGELSERQKRSLAQLNSSTGRAIRLISDLLDFSQARIGNGLQVELAELDLHAVVAEAVDELRVAFPARTLLHVTLGAGRCKASADRLVQMIGNLVANAAAYGAPDEPVVITSTVDDSSFSLAIHNGGPPIPERLIATLFDPMTRGEGDTPVHSIGLGLYIVRKIAQAHGGDALVNSSAGRGTTFTISCPRNIPDDTAVPSPLDDSAAELARQQELDRLEISALQDSAYDEIVRLAADELDAPIALISLVDGDRQWFKARVGLQATQTPREFAFCDHAIRDASHVMVVEDALVDPRFATNPLVTDQPNIRFYAGAPLVTASGYALGTVCVIDTKPRTLTETQVKTLQLTAQQVVKMMESRVQGVIRRSPPDDGSRT